MFKVLDDLERAVGRLIEKAGNSEKTGSAGREDESPVGGTIKTLSDGKPDRGSEEAAELVRRAIKRLKSL